ncbi:hypothetical protein HPB51_010388 [Rhipicephalus microplus]|uniref:Uncharacterized protein n=1 Tax=Rhipicephalus microplus TaxID=6941 RepID=A0A9J6D9A0_RHIMP|nr:hypothetical protein HPB51_010388 [Rhipicephalus microplus]
MLLSVERDVVMMQEEAVKPPPSTASSGLRATDFSIAAIMARESPGQSASWPPAAASSGEWYLSLAACSTAAFTGSPLWLTFENGRHRLPWLLRAVPRLARARAGYVLARRPHCLQTPLRAGVAHAPTLALPSQNERCSRVGPVLRICESGCDVCWISFSPCFGSRSMYARVFKERE